MDAPMIYQTLWGVAGIAVLGVLGIILGKYLFARPDATPEPVVEAIEETLDEADDEVREPQHSDPCEDCEALLLMSDSIIDREVAPNVAQWLEEHEWHRQFNPKLHAAVRRQVDKALGSEAENQTRTGS